MEPTVPVVVLRATVRPTLVPGLASSFCDALRLTVTARPVPVYLSSAPSPCPPSSALTVLTRTGPDVTTTSAMPIAPVWSSPMAFCHFLIAVAVASVNFSFGVPKPLYPTLSGCPRPP